MSKLIESLKKMITKKPLVNKDKIEKEFKSFKNKFHGQNKIWFDALTEKKQLDLLYDWKEYKWRNKDNKRSTKTISNGYSSVKIISYPPSFKYFIIGCKSTWKYRVKKEDIRDKTIDFLLNKR